MEKRGILVVLCLIFMLSFVCAIPEVSIVSPGLSEAVSTASIDFKFNVNSNLPILNCSLLINQEEVASLNSVSTSSLNTINHVFSDTNNANYFYSIKCFDSSGNSGTSQLVLFTINPAYVPPQEHSSQNAGQQNDQNQQSGDLQSQGTGNEQGGSNRALFGEIISGVVVVLIIAAIVIIILIIKNLRKGGGRQ